MPISVKFIFETKVMTPQSVQTWLLRDGCAPPQDADSDRVLRAYLARGTKTYGFLQQREFINDLAQFVSQLDWGEQRRKPERLSHFIRTLGGGRVDYTRRPEDDQYLHPKDVAFLNRAGREVTMEHLSAQEMFDVCDVLIIGETHRFESASKYLFMSHAMMAGAPRYEIRIMLDGIDEKPGQAPLNHIEVARNFPRLRPLAEPKHGDDPNLRYVFYGLEPTETSLFTQCEKIDTLTMQAQCRAAAWFYEQLRENEAFATVAKRDRGDYNALMDDANAFASTGQKLLKPSMAALIKRVAGEIEFADRSAIRMDANIEWGRSIEQVLAQPSTTGRQVKVLVLCGTNHTLSRSEHGVPVQGAIRHATVRTLVFVNDGSTTLQYRLLDNSLNYVYTVPDGHVALRHYFATPPF
ncbi:hypothetical protein ACQKGO_07665 [Corallococcus interemptor]|uniref:hypothetical protein n=1 Tax=Corallococcus interemptor TaxID=2316720 RepID=UPI003CFEADAA